MNRTIGAKEIDEYAQKYNMLVGKDTPLTMGWCFDMVDKAYEQDKSDAIDEFKSVLEGWFLTEGNSLTLIDVYRFAEQLKEQENGR